MSDVLSFDEIKRLMETDPAAAAEHEAVVKYLADGLLGMRVMRRGAGHILGGYKNEFRCALARAATEPPPAKMASPELTARDREIRARWAKTWRRARRGRSARSTMGTKADACLRLREAPEVPVPSLNLRLRLGACAMRMLYGPVGEQFYWRQVTHRLKT